MPFTIRKSLIVGLGGTGRDAVLHAKQRCQEVYGEVPPTTRFFVIDTTDSEALQLKGDVRVTLDKGEFKKLNVHDPVTLIRSSEEVQEWFPTDVPQRAIINGAGQIRALGRLALYSDTTVRGALSNLVRDINSWDKTRLTREGGKFELFDEGEKLYVSIVGSLAGGTGSGTFLDIAFLLRENLKPTDVVTAYLLLPDVFSSKPATRNVEPNAYAALRELDYYMTRETGTDEFEEFTFGGHRISIEKAPFDVVYIVNNITSAGTVYSEVSDLCEFLGRGLFMSMGASGKKTTDIWDNLQHQIIGRHKWQGRAAYLSSFGLSELVYDPSRFVRRYTRELAEDLVRRLFLGEQLDADEAVESFMQENKLREEGAKHNEVIDRLVRHREPPPFERPDRPDKRSVERMLEDRPGYLQRVTDRASTESEESFLAIREESTTNLRSLLRERLHAENGLAYCRSFLLAFRGRLESLEKEMESEGEQADRGIENESRIFQELQREKDDLPDGFFRRAAWDDLAERLKSSTVQAARWQVEKIRRSQAARLFQALVTELDKELQNLDRLRSLAEALVSSLKQELQDLRLERPPQEPFAKVFEPPAHDSRPSADLRDFLTWLSQRGATIASFPSLQLRDAKKLLLEYAAARQVVKTVQGRTIEEVLKEMPKKDRFDQIGLLGSMADPLWSFSRAHVTGKRKTEQLYLMGTQSEEGSVLDEPELAQHLETGEYQPQIVATGDATRITCLKIEAAIPAYILDRMNHYRDRFRDPDRPFTYHTSDRFESILDLFPISEDEANQKWWALALASPFDLIEARGDYYYFRSESLGRMTDDYMVKLGQGRAEALKRFLKYPEALEETRKQIEQTLRDRGTASVRNSLVEWIRKKEEEYRGRRIKPQIRDLIEMELAEVERYVSESLEEIS